MAGTIYVHEDFTTRTQNEAAHTTPVGVSHGGELGADPTKIKMYHTASAGRDWWNQNYACLMEHTGGSNSTSTIYPQYDGVATYKPFGAGMFYRVDLLLPGALPAYIQIQLLTAAATACQLEINGHVQDSSRGMANLTTSSPVTTRKPINIPTGLSSNGDLQGNVLDRRRVETPVRICMYVRRADLGVSGTDREVELWMQAPWLNGAEVGSANWACMGRIVTDLVADVIPKMVVGYLGTAGAPRANDPNIYRIGTVAVTNGSATVTGTGTVFPEWIKAGSYISINGSSYLIASRGGTTSLTLAAVWPLGNLTAQTYFITFGSPAYQMPTVLTQFIWGVDVNGDKFDPGDGFGYLPLPTPSEAQINGALVPNNDGTLTAMYHSYKEGSTDATAVNGYIQTWEGDQYAREWGTVTDHWVRERGVAAGSDYIDYVGGGMVGNALGCLVYTVRAQRVSGTTTHTILGRVRPAGGAWGTRFTIATVDSGVVVPVIDRNGIILSNGRAIIQYNTLTANGICVAYSDDWWLGDTATWVAETAATRNILNASSLPQCLVETGGKILGLCRQWIYLGRIYCHSLTDQARAQWGTWSTPNQDIEDCDGRLTRPYLPNGPSGCDAVRIGNRIYLAFYNSKSAGGTYTRTTGYFYQDGRNTRHRVYLHYSDDNGQTWQPHRRSPLWTPWAVSGQACNLSVIGNRLAMLWYPRANDGPWGVVRFLEPEDLGTAGGGVCSRDWTW